MPKSVDLVFSLSVYYRDITSMYLLKLLPMNLWSQWDGTWLLPWRSIWAVPTTQNEARTGLLEEWAIINAKTHYVKDTTGPPPPTKKQINLAYSINIYSSSLGLVVIISSIFLDYLRNSETRLFEEFRNRQLGSQHSERPSHLLAGNRLGRTGRHVVWELISNWWK